MRERWAIIDHAGHVFSLGDAKYTVWQKLRWVTSHWAPSTASGSSPARRPPRFLSAEQESRSFREGDGAAVRFS
jgi:hypothetical protein